MWLFLAVPFGPVALAALLSLFGPPRAYAARCRILSVAVGAAFLIGIAVDRLTNEGPTTDGLLRARHAITLTERTEVTVPFDVSATHGRQFAVAVQLDAALPAKRWKPLADGGWQSRRGPLPGWQVEWTVHRDGRQISDVKRVLLVEDGFGHIWDQRLVKLGWFHAQDPGAYDVHLILAQVPRALRGEHAHLLVDADSVAYKTARGKASVRNVIHLFLACSATVTLLLGVLALQLRPRTPVAADQELQERT